jgi:hypothetical protein
MTSRADTPRRRSTGQDENGPRKYKLQPTAAEVSAVLMVFTLLDLPLGVAQLIMPLVVRPWLAAGAGAVVAGVLGVGCVCVARLSRRWRTRLELRTWMVVAIVAAAIVVGWLSGVLMGGRW